MKKILFAFLLVLVVLGACKEDDYLTPTFPQLDQTEQNKYDDEAIAAYLENTYINSRGKLTESKTDINNDSINNRKLADLNPITLPSGVVYIIIPDAQPTSGSNVMPDDFLQFQQVGTTMRAVKTDNKIQFANQLSFFNTIDGSGVPLSDPQWYHVKQSVLDAAKAKADKDPTEDNKARTKKSYYEIEGFQEAIQKFKSFNLPEDADYNLQGIIIVPSRAAFAKEPHFNYVGIGLNDFSFVFNFQLYKARTRTAAEQ